MKRTSIILVLGIAVSAFLFSCAGMKEHSAKEAVAKVPAEVAKEVSELPEGALLVDKHKAAGISCNDCHAGDPNATAVTTDTCMTCHGDYNEVAASYLDPHNAHISYSNCSDCHHLHRESEKICQGCHHTFNVQAP